MNVQQIDRRQLLAGAGAAAAWTIVKPARVRGSQANSKIELGITGCGGRGKWIADLFQQNGGYQVVTAHDYFADRVDAVGDAHQIPANRRYTTLSGYGEMLKGKLDAVAIISPPYFHPQQAAEAVEAGKHVFIAKPVAVDVPGCHDIAAAGKKATASKLAFLVDFQTRADALFIEAIGRVHAGAIGKLCFGEASYHTDRIGKRGEDKTAEGRLRNWVFDKALSGDIITEQNVHTLDVMSWIMNQAPVCAYGTGGRKSRIDAGDCWDHFALTFIYPNSVGISFTSRQCDGYGSQPDGIRNRMFGVLGTLETQYGGQVLIRGKKPYPGGQTGSIYKDGAVANIATFRKDILSGKFDNPTVAPSVRSNLVTILGRTAAYTGRVVTWDETVKSTERLDGKLEGLKV